MTADFEPPPLDPLSLDPLSELRWDWGEAYEITGAAGHWIAQRRDDGSLLSASDPGTLRQMIAEDYRERPVPREVAP